MQHQIQGIDHWQLPAYIEGCSSTNPDIQIENVRNIRRILGSNDPPISHVVSSGIVTRLVEFLHFDHMPQLQQESAHALTNIAVENTFAVIRANAVPIFVKLLESESDEVKDQAVWALGNIAGEAPECRNLVLSNGALEALLPLCHTNIRTQTQVKLLRNICWTLSNFCRGKPSPQWKYVQPIINTLSVMLNSEDEEILQDVAWGLSYLADVENVQHFDAIKDSGSLDRLIHLLNHESVHVRHPALRTLGNIVNGSDEQTQYVLDLGLLKQFHRLMTSDKGPIKREACWTVSNVTAGSEEWIEAVISNNLFQPLINILKTEEYAISKEALWAISNATSGGSEQQITFLVDQGVIPALFHFLKNVNNPKILMVALKGIANILRVGRAKTTHDQFGGRNQFAEYMEENGGVDDLKQLQSNDSLSDDVNEKAAALIEDYFPVTLVHFMRWINNAPKRQQRRVRERKGSNWILSMEQPMKLLLSGYGHSGREFDDEIPSDILGMTIRFLAGSTLNVKQDLAGRGKLDDDTDSDDDSNDTDSDDDLDVPDSDDTDPDDTEFDDDSEDHDDDDSDDTDSDDTDSSDTNGSSSLSGTTTQSSVS